MGGDNDIKHSQGGPSVFGALFCTVCHTVQVSALTQNSKLAFQNLGKYNHDGMKGVMQMTSRNAVPPVRKAIHHIKTIRVGFTTCNELYQFSLFCVTNSAALRF
jgi:hypothetical protein